ncbi:MAG TPA: DUF2911 domain-containing protein [Chitinophagaceae bacterium]|nr:DUF2911 domain-containing protein [Chitinophagaceae bacterium]
MKTNLFAVVLFFFTGMKLSLGQITINMPLPSQKAFISQRIGLTDISMEYHRPSVNGRKIWGGLVPYEFNSPGPTGSDAPWRTGANDNPIFSITHDIKIEGKDIKAGKYGFFVAVNENNTATVVLSKDTRSWGSFFYDPKQDVLRVNVNTKTIPNVELLTFSFDEVKPESAILSLKWADKEIPVRIDVDVDNIVINDFKEQFKNPVAFSWHSRQLAATYLLGRKSNLSQALEWANQSIYGLPGGFTGEKNFVTLTTKESILFLMDSIPQSKETLAEALKVTNAGNTALGAVNFYGRSLITAKRKEDALTVFTFMLKEWPNVPASKIGMGRALSANGNYKEALKYITEALATVPPAQKKTLEGFIELLKQGKDIN